MLVLTGFSGMAHAADQVGGSIAGIEFTVHASDDIDEVQSDADKNYPHHHNYCHGHETGHPAYATLERGLDLAGPRLVGAIATTLRGHDSQIHLRPPQA